MFGHDDQQQHQQDDHGQDAQVTAPTHPPSGDAAGLGDESQMSAPAVTDPAGGFIMDPPLPAQANHNQPGASHTAGGTGTSPSDDLLKIKQEALQHLSPLVGHLDQPPEEKFRTLMMMIQASDDQTKLQEAYDVAKQITDEKTRAQALLDVVNEINYFTQQHKSSS